MSAFDAAGWYANARHVPSPNQSARPAGVAIDLLVIHNISLPPGQFGGPGVEQLFTNSIAPQDPLFADLGSLRVSAHFFYPARWRGGAVCAGDAKKSVSCRGFALART